MLKRAVKNNKLKTYIICVHIQTIAAKFRVWFVRFRKVIFTFTEHLGDSDWSSVDFDCSLASLLHRIFSWINNIWKYEMFLY